MRIGALIRKPIRVDRETEEGARGNYARVCVEVDLSKPLLAKYKVEGIKYHIQYEGLDGICTECGRYGRSTDQCNCKSLKLKSQCQTQWRCSLKLPRRRQCQNWLMATG
ncbi:unnamed protein product [Linum tenue]|nr:unnamed protein product [Linum tenue]